MRPDQAQSSGLFYYPRTGRHGPPEHFPVLQTGPTLIATTLKTGFSHNNQP